MSARLASATDAPGWSVAECLDSVEKRCLRLINPTPAITQGVGTFDAATRAADYHLRAGGRRIRARLALDAALQLGLSARTAIIIASTCELLHNASLVHDDLQDRDATRRGAAAVWQCFGEDTAICAGDLLLSSAYACLAELDDVTYLPQMLTLVHLRTSAAIQGQSADVAHRTQPVQAVASYLQIVAGKSGALLSLPLELALVAAGLPASASTARQAADAFAIGYQIADDLDDISKDTGAGSKAATLNIALLLQANDKAQDQHDTTSRNVCAARARRQSIALARKHLTLAAAQASALPCRCGQLLVQLATELQQQL